MHTTSKHEGDPNLSTANFQLDFSLGCSERAGCTVLTLRTPSQSHAQALGMFYQGRINVLKLVAPVNVLNLGEHKLQSTHEDDPGRL